MANVSKLLAGGPEQDFIDVNLLRLPDGERDRPCKGLGGDGDIRIELTEPLGDVRLGPALGQLGGHGPRGVDSPVFPHGRFDRP